MVSVSWLATTAAAATSRNLPNRLPTEVWSLLFTAALIRDGPNVMRHPRLGGPADCAADNIKLHKPWRQIAGGHWAAILATVSPRRECRSESARPVVSWPYRAKATRLFCDYAPPRR